MKYRAEYVIGDFFTFITSPGFIILDGLACAPLMFTLPFLQASAAMVLVLNILAAHNHLSILASAILYLLLYWFIVLFSPARQKLFIISPARLILSGSIFLASSSNSPKTKSICPPFGKSLPIPKRKRE